MIEEEAPRNLELRFTRAGQSAGFWIASAVFFAGAITLITVSLYRQVHPELPHPLWAVLPAAAGWVMARVAVHLTRHAYLILTPLGVEVFPFFRPASGMRMFAWIEIHEAELSRDGTCLTLHFNRDHTAGVHLSLRPVRRAQRSLLMRAMLGRVGERVEE